MAKTDSCCVAHEQNVDPVCGMKVASDSKYFHPLNGKNYYFCSEHCLHKFKDHPQSFISEQATEPLTDPVCGMSVTPETKLKYTLNNKTYRFCSDHCLTKFQQNPQDYLQPSAPSKSKQPVDENAVYTCPMDPEVEQIGPGTCPKCGMALEPMGIPVQATRTEYTCPMHPEVIQDHPGSCPKCGMALEAKTVFVEEKNEELEDMSRRFWIGLVFAIPVFVLAMMADMVPQWIPDALSMHTVQWIQFVLATPVVLWGGLAVLCAWLAVGQNMEPEHVYLDWFRGFGGMGV